MSSHKNPHFCTFSTNERHRSTDTLQNIFQASAYNEKKANETPAQMCKGQNPSKILLTVTARTAYHEALSMHHRVTAAFCNVTFNVAAHCVPMHHLVMMMCCWCIGPSRVHTAPAGRDNINSLM